MIVGKEFQSLIYSIFDGDVKGYLETPQIKVNCPQCQEREQLSQPDGKYNLEINTEKLIFHCWKCAEPRFSGHIGKLIYMYGSGIDKKIYKTYDTNERYFNRFRQNQVEEVKTDVSLPNEYIPFSKMDNSNPLHVEAYMYMVMERKIDREQLLKYRVGFCIEGYYNYRIIIPSYDKNGELDYFIGRAYRKDMEVPYQNPKANKKFFVFNEGYVNWDSTVYIVEGVFEMFTIPNSIPQLGKVLMERTVELLGRFKPNVVVALDPDAYYNSLEMFQYLKLLYGADEDKIKIIKLKGKYDLDELRRNYGETKVVEVLKQATTLSIEDNFKQRRRMHFNERQNRYKRFNK